MTREEAINILNRDDDSMRKGYFCINDFEAIEVLKSEESILDKIKAEIMDTGAYEQETMGQTAFLNGINYCLGVIDKYKEDKENDN